MNLYFRLIWLLLKNIFRKEKNDPLANYVTSFHVLPNDLDLNFHMNNGRYLTIMDLARIDFMCKTGLFRVALKNKWWAVLGASQMIFLRPLKLLQKYQIHTSMECWDHKWLVMKQIFISNGKVVAIGKIRGLLRGSNGNISPETIMQAVYNKNFVSPIPSKETQLWLNSLKQK